MRRNIVYFILVFVLFSFLSVQASTSVPHIIRVGLKFSSTAPASVSISSNTGLEFGYWNNSNFISLITINSQEAVHVRKDSYYVINNGLVLEVPASEISKHSGKSFGPYHIQISENFTSRALAEELKKSAANSGIDAFIVYENGWRVWTGRYVTKEEMETKLSEIKTKLNSSFETYTVYPSGDRLQINDNSGNVLLMFDRENTFLVSKSIEQKGTFNLMTVDGRKFRGSIEFKRQDSGDITVVNPLTMQEYLYGVVPREMGADWHIEALKAQAVVARNYAMVNLSKHSSFGFDVCSGVDCQAYGGYDWEKPTSNKAVDQTDGQILVYNNSPVSAFFHASSGGYTENSENVWSASLPYLRAVEDKFDAKSPHYGWQLIKTSEEMRSLLAGNGIDIGSVTDIRVDSYTNTGRSLLMTITGTKGTASYEKEKSRALLGYNNLKSTMFTVNSDAEMYALGEVGKPIQKISTICTKVITASGVKSLEEGPDRITLSNGTSSSTVNKYPTKFIFTGNGWGHGLGLSQWGAKGMAEAGYTYREILEYYYKGAILQ